ncbi:MULTISPECIES: TMEM175 family protein [unclassified Acidisoma]|uniref:TMEM175 family protein n=1 Tax=unclassified Acidisoma TaxID=2634065 RepID=UPI00131B3669
MFIAIIRVNHHDLVKSARKVDISTLWANIMMLFTMSFIPFATTHLAEQLRSPMQVAIYNGLFLPIHLRFSTRCTRHCRDLRKPQLANSESTLVIDCK